MNKEKEAFDICFVHLQDAQYEVQHKSKLSRLIIKLINKLRNNHTAYVYHSLPFYVPAGVTLTEVANLLSYYLKNELAFINGNINLSKEDIIQKKKYIAQNTIPEALSFVGFKTANITTDTEHFCFLESGNYKNEEYKENFANWYNPDVTLKEAQAIFEKIKENSIEVE